MKRMFLLGALAGCMLDVKTHGSFSRSSAPTDVPAPAPAASASPIQPVEAPAPDAHNTTTAPPTPVVAVSAAPPEPRYSHSRYEGCAKDFERDYDAWLPNDRVAKAAIASARGKSPYEALTALLAAYDAVDKKSLKRQNGQWPPGALYAQASHLEIMAAIAEIGVKAHIDTCLDTQFRVEMSSMGSSFLPPLTGDRDQDKAIQCGGPNGAESTYLEVRGRVREAFNGNMEALHNEELGTTAGLDGGRFVSMSSNSKETVIAFRHTHATGECVANGRVKVAADGSVGEQCDWVYGKDEAERSVITYHLSNATKLPFKLQPGDDFAFRYELDPDAPASEHKVALRGGWWQIRWAGRGDKTVFNACRANGNELEIRSPHQTIGRRAL